MTMTSSPETAKNWFVGVSFKQELFSEYMIQRGHRHTGPLLGLSRPINYRKYVDSDICGVREDWDGYAEEVRCNYQEHLPRMFNIVKTASDSFIEFTKGINAKQLSQLSNQGLAAVFSDFCKYYENAAGLIAVPFLGEMALVPALKERISPLLQERGISFSDFVRIISFPSTETVISQERTDLLEMAKVINHNASIKKIFHANKPEEIIKQLIQQDKKLLQKIEDHSAQYPWILKTLLQGEDYTPEKVIKRLKDFLVDNFQEKMGIAAQEKEERIKEINKIMEWLPQKYVRDIDLLQELIYFRDARLMWLNEGCHYSFPLFQEIARRLNATFEEVIYLLPEEIEQGLQGTLPVSKEELSKRIDKYALVMENHQITLYTGDGVEQQRVKAEIKAEVEVNGVEVQGHSASPGKAQGKVRIIKDRLELHKVEKGDILVTKLTTPDFVVAMEKAAAIVTDLGGITSHAAIVSRELGIPCVVGTELATKIFKDGDLVEVNAEKGIVRKLP